MDSKYVIGIIVILIMALGAYEVYTHETSDKKITIADSTSVQSVAEKLVQAYRAEHPELK